MKGGVRKRGSTWSYYFDIGIINGKRKKKEKGGFKTKKEAQEGLNKAMYEFENGGFIVPKKTSTGEYLLSWLTDYVKPIRKITTFNRYNELVRKYLIPYLGGITLMELKPFHIEKMLISIKNESTISGSTLQQIYTVLSTALNKAIKSKILNDNPCKYVERPKRNKFIANTLTIEEINKIFETLTSSKEYYDYIFHLGTYLTLELGLRRGELGGLEWENINFKEQTVTIKNNLIYTNGHVALITPKTLESERTLYLSDEAIELLKKHHKIQSENKLKYGTFYEVNMFNDNKFNFIMTWENGKYVHPNYYTSKLKKVLRKAGISKNIRFHDLRHTNATLLIEQGVNFKVVQTRLGHTDISTTLNIYSHVDKEMQKDATEKLTNLFNGGKTVAK